MVANNKALGQHWLKNRSLLETIAELAGNGPLCVEIGPGLGFLTSSLLKRFDKVIAVEFDQRLATNLPKSFPGKNLTVVNQDILQFDFDSLDSPYVVAGNIPYYITSPIIKKVLTTPNPPKKIVLLIQKEVAERILDDRETLLSLFVKNHATALSGPIVDKLEFTPPPKVDSQVIILEPHAPIISDEVFALIRQGFSSPRKKLIRNLISLYPQADLENAFAACDINANVRPGDIKLPEWNQLAKTLAGHS